MSKKVTAATISPAIQRVFLSAALIYILSQLITEAHFMLNLHSISGISSYLWLLMYTVVFPLLLFVIAFLLHPRRAVKIPIIFESAFLAVAGFLVYGSLSYLGAFVPERFFSSTSQWTWLISQAVLFGICGIVYVGVLYTLRRTKRW